MKHILRTSTCLAATAITFATAAPALADGTQAGEDITHTVTASYNVNGVAQTDETASDTFYVDRKVNVVVAPVSTSPNAPAGSTGVVREYSVTNTSNAAVGFALAVSQDVGAGYTISNVQIWIDANDNDTIDGGEAAITFIDSIAIDITQNIKVRFDVPQGVADGSSSDIILTADAVETGSSGATQITATAGANTAGSNATDIETVLADGAGETDAANAGDFSAAHTLSIDAANLTLTKTSTVVSDPVNLAINPKAIPGAVVEYCIVASNSSGATAESISVSDDFTSESANITFVPDAYGSGADVVLDGDGACSGGTPTDSSYTVSTTIVSEALSDVAAGNAASLRYRVTIN